MFTLMIEAASYLFIASPAILVVVAVATGISDYFYNKSLK